MQDEYDVIHVESNEGVKFVVGQYMDKLNRTYIGLGCLEDLRVCLQDGDRAKVWCVGGDLAENPGETKTYCPQKAFNIIRRVCPGAKILHLSLNDDAEQVAREEDVDFVSKENPEAVAVKLEEMLD